MAEQFHHTSEELLESAISAAGVIARVIEDAPSADERREILEVVGDTLSGSGIDIADRQALKELEEDGYLGTVFPVGHKYAGLTFAAAREVALGHKNTEARNLRRIRALGRIPSNRD